MSPRQNNDALFSAHAILAALKSSTRVLRWLMVALGVIYLGSGIKMVGPNENGLLLRFGKMLGRPHPPGLLFALPGQSMRSFSYQCAACRKECSRNGCRQRSLAPIGHLPR